MAATKPIRIGCSNLTGTPEFYACRSYKLLDNGGMMATGKPDDVTADIMSYIVTAENDARRDLIERIEPLMEFIYPPDEEDSLWEYCPSTPPSTYYATLAELIDAQSPTTDQNGGHHMSTELNDKQRDTYAMILMGARGFDDQAWTDLLNGGSLEYDDVDDIRVQASAVALAARHDLIMEMIVGLDMEGNIGLADETDNVAYFSIEDFPILTMQAFLRSYLSADREQDVKEAMT